MKYAELNVSFNDPETWNYTPASPKPLRFQRIWRDVEAFKQSRDKLKEELTRNIIEPLDNCEREEQISIVLDPILERYSKAYFMQEHVNEELLLKKANRNTLGKKLQEWLAQLNQNAGLVKRSPGTGVFYNKFKNVPCVIVAAGPSLGTNIDLLKEVQGKAVIMSVDTSFRSCYKRGITPTFCNAHDANINGQRFFKGQPCPDTVGLFVNYIHPETIASYQGPLAFYYVSDNSIPAYTTMMLACEDDKRKDPFFKSGVTGGSSVGHTALYLALLMGCNPITYLGFDLSYPDMENSHFETDNPKDLRQKKLIDVEDVQGRIIKTDLSFYSYKTVAEKMFPTMAQIYGAQLFNSTEDKNGKPAGIIHSGLKPIPFRDFIDRFCKEDRTELKQVKELYYGKELQG